MVKRSRQNGTMKTTHKNKTINVNQILSSYKKCNHE